MQTPRKSSRIIKAPVRFEVSNNKTPVKKVYPKTPVPKKAALNSTSDGNFKAVMKVDPPSKGSTRKRNLELSIADVSGEVEPINSSVDVSFGSSDNDHQPRSDYFHEVSVKVLKSENTLKKLDLSVLQNASKCSENDKAAREAVIRCQERVLFPNVYSLLISGFNVILYGVGSKRILLDRFKDGWLCDERYLKICGYFPELNLKIILIKLSALFDIEATSNEKDFFEPAANLGSDRFLVIHSMDVLFQTDPKVKRFLIKLYAECRGKLHIIATVDNINSALMFDLKQAQQLNLVHLEATTYESYDLEVGYIQSANKKNKKGMLGLNGLTSNGILNVYNSLPANSKSVLLLIFREWMAYRELNRKLTTKKSGKQDEEAGKGLDFKRVAISAREQFLANSGMLLSFANRQADVKSVDH